MVLEPISEKEEEVFWMNDMLGDSSPQTLLDTMVYMNRLYFAMRSGSEHRALCFEPCQIEVIKQEDQRPYLVYTEDSSKNRPGDLKGRKYKSVRSITQMKKPQKDILCVYLNCIEVNALAILAITCTRGVIMGFT